MDWKLYDENGDFLQEVNCQYDSLDFAQYEDAVEVIVNFEKKEARIVKKKKGVE